MSEIKPQYESIKIGNQEWMTRNLDVDRFRKGDLIPRVDSYVHYYLDLQEKDVIFIFIN